MSKTYLIKKGTDFMINIKTFESNGSAYGSDFYNALRRASEQLKEFINEFLKENNINNSNILSLDIKHNIESNNDGYEYCFMTAVLCYK